MKLQTKPRRTRNIVLEDDEVRAFLDVSYRSVTSATIAAVKQTFVFSGLRVDEVRKLDRAHVDLEAALLTVYDSKNTALKGLDHNKDRDTSRRERHSGAGESAGHGWAFVPGAQRA